MYKALSALAAAAIVAGSLTFLPSFTAEVSASTPIPSAKSDRLDARPLGAECSKRGWPYYETDCMRDMSKRAGQALPVRTIALQ